MFVSLKIKSIVIFSTIFLITLMLSIGFMGMYSTNQSVSLLRNISIKDQASATTLTSIRLQMELNRSQILQALQHNPNMEWHTLHDHPLEVHFDLVENFSAEATRMWEQYLAGIESPEELKLANDWYTTSAGLGLDYVKRASAHIKAGQWDDAETILIKNINPTYHTGDKTRATLSAFRLQRISASDKHIKFNLAAISYGMIAATIIGGLLCAAVGWLLIQIILQPLNQALGIATSVAEGNLSEAIKAGSSNEIGLLVSALGKMKMRLASIVTDVRVGTETIARASSEIAVGNLDLSQRTEEQASSLEETASSIKELASTVKQNSEHALQANQLAQSASVVASKGGAVVSQVVTTMNSINQSSKKIVDIISVIDGIAFQTNILALNAAVEAARAGEQGRGFAVVASEVRNLAQRSAAAAKEIKTLINDSVEKVDSGNRLVDEAGITMTAVVDSIQRVTNIMGKITAASHEQTLGIDQISEAIGQMDSITQQNAALVEEAAAASDSLQRQADNLVKVVSIFKLDGESNATIVRASTTHTKPGARTAPIPLKRKPVKADIPKKNTAHPPPMRLHASAAQSNDWEEF
jgi:methyl-accepting chemotaxis protein